MMNEPEKPKQLPQINLDSICESAQQYIDFFWSDEYHDDLQSDYENHIFETVIVSIFGNDAFDLINAMSDCRDE